MWYIFSVYNGICCLIEAKFTRHTLTATMTTSRTVFRASRKQSEIILLIWARGEIITSREKETLNDECRLLLWWREY